MRWERKQKIEEVEFLSVAFFGSSLLPYISPDLGGRTTTAAAAADTISLLLLLL